MVENEQDRHVHVETVITGGQVVFPDGTRRAEVGIADGSIVAIGSPGSLQAEHEIDATGMIVMPGGIDPHTHIQWPLAGADTGHDDFRSATRRAAAWGTTTIVDFVPGTAGSLLEAAERRLEQAEVSLIDYSLHPVVTRLNDSTIREIPRLITEGMSSFKVYTTYNNRLESADVRRFVRVASEAGGLPGFHAEHHPLLEDALTAARKLGNLRSSGFPASRPDHTESAAIREITGYAREFDAPTYIYHVSSAAALAEINNARDEGTDVRAETCAHYLTFDDSAYGRADGWKYVITPPIRGAHDQQVLWRAVADGQLDAVASDHCAYSVKDKRAGFEDFTAMEPGAPGIASRMPVLWQRGVNDERLTLEQFVRANSERPAQVLGLSRKGKIGLGYDADLVVWDPGAQWEWGHDLDGDNGTDYDIYAGVQGKGRPRFTLSRGTVVFGENAVESHHGQFTRQDIRK